MNVYQKNQVEYSKKKLSDGHIFGLKYIDDKNRRMSSAFTLEDTDLISFKIRDFNIIKMQ